MSAQRLALSTADINERGRGGHLYTQTSDTDSTTKSKVPKNLST